MQLNRKILIALALIGLSGYFVYYVVSLEPPKMTRHCITSHTESLTVMTYDLLLKRSVPKTYSRDVCDVYSDWYINPDWERWAAKQETT